MPSSIQLPNGFDDLRIHALPSGRVLNVTKAVRIDGTTVFVDTKGKVYCPRVRDRSYYTINDWVFIRTLLPALVKLGVISKETFKEYLDAVAEKQSSRSAKHNKEEYLMLCRTYNLKPSKTHLRVLDEKIGA